MGHENGDEQRPVKRRHVQGMLDETGPLKRNQANSEMFYYQINFIVMIIVAIDLNWNMLAFCELPMS